MHIEPRARTMRRRRGTGDATTTLGFAFTRVAPIRIITLPPLRRKAGLHHQFEKVRSERPPLRQVQDRMNHPLWVTRLLEIDKTERPGRVRRIDHVTDAECDRLAPDHDLIADPGGQRTGFAFPPG